MERARRHALRPVLERMETRELLSVAFHSANAHGFPANLPLVRQASVAGSGASSPVIGLGDPTPHERHREAFRAVFTGSFHAGPGRFSDQAKTFAYRGAGGSNFFLHGNYQMAIVLPKDPNAPAQGLAVLFDKSTNSGGIVGLDVTSDGVTFDRFGRPSSFRLVGDPNIYGGVFFVDNSVVNARVRYVGNTATVVFQGDVFTTGLTDPLRNAEIQGRGGRLTPRGGP